MAACTAITRGGGRCKGIAIDSSGLCHAHHPDRAEQRSRAARKGGIRGGRGRPQVELADLKARLSGLADDVLEGKADRGNAAVAAQVLNVYLRAVSVELKVVEQREFLERLEALERVAEDRNGGSRWGT